MQSKMDIKVSRHLNRSIAKDSQTDKKETDLAGIIEAAALELCIKDHQRPVHANASASHKREMLGELCSSGVKVLLRLDGHTQF